MSDGENITKMGCISKSTVAQFAHASRFSADII